MNTSTSENRMNLESYLYRAARNQVLRYIRSEKVLRKYAENLIPFLSAIFDNSTEELMELQESRELIEERVSGLPAKCQQAFRMSRFEHKSIKEIADEMNISSRTVENYISQALGHLRKRLERSMWLLFFLVFFRQSLLFGD